MTERGKAGKESNSICCFADEAGSCHFIEKAIGMIEGANREQWW